MRIYFIPIFFDYLLIAGPMGFDPTTCGSEDRRDILTTLRAQVRFVETRPISIELFVNRFCRSIFYTDINKQAN